MNHALSLEAARATYQPKLPDGLRNHAAGVPSNHPPAASESIRTLFPATFDLPAVTFDGPPDTRERSPLRIGVILSGGPAPGGHNVIAGLFDALKAHHPESTVFGFLNGPGGLLANKGRELDAEVVNAYRNTGGFDIVGSGRTKLETDADFRKALETAAERGLTGLVVIGGDDSNTNACRLAEFARNAGSSLLVTGVPKTIDGDLKGGPIETSFGFDTACKVYSELIGNLHRDALSVRKYWHFIKLMGRSASHIALECALQTRPSLALISEEAAAKGWTLQQIVDQIADGIALRAANGENFGTLLIPEGIVEFIPEMRKLISELNDVLAANGEPFAALDALDAKRAFVTARLTPPAAELYGHLPLEIANQLILDRDPHGNVQVAKIDTQRLFVDLVSQRLKERKAAGTYGGSFESLSHYFGYEGRCAAPSNFDADYTYTLGYTAALLQREGLNGYIVSVRHLTRPVSQWIPGGIPLSRLMHLERRHGADVPVIRKALVDLEGAPFRAFQEHRSEWTEKTQFAFPGPLQYFGPTEVCDRTTITLELENGAGVEWY